MSRGHHNSIFGGEGGEGRGGGEVEVIIIISSIKIVHEVHA